MQAAFVAEQHGADGITVHLREDRRHIQDRDVRLLKELVSTSLNLEMSLAPTIVDLAVATRPDQVTLVPERREEVTTEGGLDVAGQAARVAAATKRLAEAGARVSLFIAPERDQIEASAEAGAAFVELHTGCYANAWGDPSALQAELTRLGEGAAYAVACGLRVNAGHGLTYHNVQPVAAIAPMEELNIGHSILARALMAGLGPAVAEMKRLLVESRWRAGLMEELSYAPKPACR